MAARDILNLNTSIAPRLIRCLYLVALILITVMVLLGLVRGVRTMMRTPPPPRPAIAQNQTTTPAAPAPDATPAPQPPRPGMMNPAQRRMMMMRRFGPRRPMMPFGFGRNPVAAGLWMILGTLLHGAIGLLVVRILAEMGLAVLAMPRRSEI